MGTNMGMDGSVKILIHVRNIPTDRYGIDNAVMSCGRIFFSSAATGGTDGSKNQANPKPSSTQRDYGIPPTQDPNIGSVRSQF